ncbi:uncharacterized protein LOC142229708 [Haematobia irritans]|uniref:uncharacterized protein LOC142229708 n=1 Tax=Haematobia irritans TaxID=7368 RepID=UPI003F4F6038
MHFRIRIKNFIIILIITIGYIHLAQAQADDFKLNLAPIKTDEVQLEPLKENQYSLRISVPGSRREEIISLEPSDLKTADPVVVTRGEYDINYEKEDLNLVVTYVADHNGYRASYRIVKGIQPEISFGPRLNANDLKSLAG